MHLRLWITGEKSPFATLFSFSLFFVSPVIIRGKRSVNTPCESCDSLSRAATPPSPSPPLPPMPIDTSDSYALCRISHRVYLNGILYAVSTWRSLSIARFLPFTSSCPPFLSRALSFSLSLFCDDACLIVFAPFIRVIRDL